MADETRREPLDPIIPPEDVEPARERAREPEPDVPERGREANPPNTTEGGVTAPKFGSAGSGGAEYEPAPGT